MFGSSGFRITNLPVEPNPRDLIKEHQELRYVHKSVGNNTLDF